MCGLLLLLLLAWASTEEGAPAPAAPLHPPCWGGTSHLAAAAALSLSLLMASSRSLRITRLT